MRPMNEQMCRLLQDYLVGSLDAPDREKYELHLPGCGMCRGEIALQQSLDDTLRVANDAVGIPATLVSPIEQRIRTVTRRRRMTRAASLAALLLVAIATTVALHRLRPEVSVPSALDQPVKAQHPLQNDVGGVASQNAFAGTGASIRFPDEGQFTAAEVKSEDPTITIFMVYPVYTPVVQESF